MSVHSSTPWETSIDAVPDHHTQVTVYASDGARVATVFRNEANVRLIRAAPKLLEAAKLVHNDLIDCGMDSHAGLLWAAIEEATDDGS